MSRLIFDITEEQREKLELHRQAFGLRSAAEAMRDLINRFTCKPMRMSEPDPRTDQVADGAGGRPALPKPRPASVVPEAPVWPPTRAPGSMLKKERK